MYAPKYFTSSVFKTNNKLLLACKFFFNVIKNNLLKFLLCSLLAVFSAIFTYNGALNLTNLIHSENERKATERVFQEMEKKHPGYVSLTKTQVEEVKSDFEQRGGIKIEDKKDFSFGLDIFGLKLFKSEGLNIWGFLIRFLFILVLIRAFIAIMHYTWINYCVDGIEKELKKDIFNIFVNAKYSQSSIVARETLSHLSDDAGIISDLSWNILNRITYSFIYIILVIKCSFDFGNGIIGSSSSSSSTNWRFLLILFSLFLVVGTSSLFLFRKAIKLNLQAKKNVLKDNNLLFETVQNIEYVKTVSGEKYEMIKARKKMEESFQRRKKSIFLSMIYRSVPNWLLVYNIPLFFIIIILFFGKYGIFKVDESFIFINIVLYLTSARRLNEEISKIMATFLTLDEFMASTILIKDNFSPMLCEKKSSGKLIFENEDIKFENVSLSYPERPEQYVLRDMNFFLKKGKRYGIVGSNGIGKSTIVKALLKLYDLSRGVIKIGEYDIQEIDTVSLHENICYQTNHPTLFSISIAQNVYYPNECPENYHEELTVIAEKVGILDFISKQPKGFDTILDVNMSGPSLSEGQKQQILAMKIFIRDYEIYILDEPFANVSASLKKDMLEDVFSHIKKKTTIVIDHHFEIYKYLDQIYRFTKAGLTEVSKEELILNS